MKKIIPLGENVLIRLAKIDKITKSGIILPGENENEKYQQGQVVLIGESKEINSKIKLEAKVIFERYEGIEMDDGQDKFIIIKSKKILAIME